MLARPGATYVYIATFGGIFEIHQLKRTFLRTGLGQGIMDSDCVTRFELRVTRQMLCARYLIAIVQFF